MDLRAAIADDFFLVEDLERIRIIAGGKIIVVDRAKRDWARRRSSPIMAAGLYVEDAVTWQIHEGDCKALPPNMGTVIETMDSPADRFIVIRRNQSRMTGVVVCECISFQKMLPTIVEFYKPDNAKRRSYKVFATAPARVVLRGIDMSEDAGYPSSSAANPQHSLWLTQVEGLAIAEQLVGNVKVRDTMANKFYDVKSVRGMDDIGAFTEFELMFCEKIST